MAGRGSAPGERRGGRKIGATNRRTREIAEKAIVSGLTPLEYMLSVMRDETASQDRRDEMARAAAPYIHPRLQTTKVEGAGPDGDLNIVVRFFQPENLAI